jgi:spermidine synthase
MTIREDFGTGLVTEVDLEEVLYNQRTRFHDVLIAMTRPFGKGVFMDGNGQSFECDEGVYHAALVHPAMMMHENPRRVLIGGGGEGATLREVLRHESVELVRMIDIDEEAVAAFREHLPEWHEGAFDDPRADVRFGDLRAALQEHDEDPYDVAIMDLGDPVQGGPSVPIYTKEFFALLRSVLAPGAIIGMQAGELHHGATENYRSLRSTVATAFPATRPYRCPVPSFTTAWGFLLASAAELPSEAFDAAARFAALRSAGLRHFDAAGLEALAWMPPSLHTMLDRPGAILED